MFEIKKNRLFWRFRRLFIGIPSSALVLEVGSGGNPYPRSNVLLDAYEETQERHWEALKHDRPTILSFGEKLPFRDKTFDFVIAAHVLEHSPFPEKFLQELQRVGKAGYIETPDAFMERINPYKDHRLEVTVRVDQLVIRKKPSWIYDKDLVELYENKAKKIITRETIPQHPADFHVRYYWKDKINFSIVNPEVDANWTPPTSTTENSVVKIGLKSLVRLLLLSFVNKLFTQTRRNSKLNIFSLIKCQKCDSENMGQKSETEIFCKNCGEAYKKVGNIFYLK